MGLFSSISRTILGQKPWLVAKILAGDDYRFWVQIMTRDEFSGPNDYASLALSYYASLLYLIGIPGGLKSPETVRFLRLMMTVVLTDMNAWRGSILESVRSSGTKLGLGDLALVSSRMDLKESHEITLNLQRMMAGKSPGVLLPTLEVELAKNATPRQHALSVIALMQRVSDIVPEDSRIRMLAAFDAFQHASEGSRFDEWDYTMGFNKLVAICVEVPDSKVQKLKEYYEMLWRTASAQNTSNELQLLAERDTPATHEPRATPNASAKSDISTPTIQSQPSAATPLFMTSEPSRQTEDAWYEQALEELENGQTHKATWARSLAEANGEDQKARATYIRLRVAQLAAVREAERAAQAEAERIAKVEEERVARADPKAEKERVKQAMAEGIAKVEAERALRRLKP